MILNVLERKIINLNVHQNLKNILIKPLHSNSKKFNGWNKTDILISISFKLIKICDKLIRASQYNYAEATIEFIQSTISQIYSFQQSYIWTLLKIRIIVLRLHFICEKSEQDRNQSKQVYSSNLKESTKILQKHKLLKIKEIYLDRVTGFCDVLLKNKYFVTLQSDWYSFIEIILYYGIRNTLHNKDYAHCTILINKNKEILEIQISKLCSLLKMEDKKIFEIIKVKSDLLLKVYGFQLFLLYIQNRYEPSEESISFVSRKYEDTFNKVPHLLSKDEIDKTIKQIFLCEEGESFIYDECAEKSLSLFSQQISTQGMTKNTMRYGRQKKLESQKIQIMREKQNIDRIQKQQSENKNKTNSKIRVKFAQDDHKITQFPRKQSSSEDICETQLEDEIKTISDTTKQYLMKLQKGNQNFFKISKDRNRFLSIQYQPVSNLHESTKIKGMIKSVKKFQNDQVCCDQSATVINTNCQLEHSYDIHKDEKNQTHLTFGGNNISATSWNKFHKKIQIFRIARAVSVSNLQQTIKRRNFSTSSSLQKLNHCIESKPKEKNKVRSNSLTNGMKTKKNQNSHWRKPQPQQKIDFCLPILMKT